MFASETQTGICVDKWSVCTLWWKSWSSSELVPAAAQSLVRKVSWTCRICRGCSAAWDLRLQEPIRAIEEKVKVSIVRCGKNRLHPLRVGKDKDLHPGRSWQGSNFLCLPAGFCTSSRTSLWMRCRPTSVLFNWTTATLQPGWTWEPSTRPAASCTTQWSATSMRPAARPASTLLHSRSASSCCRWGCHSHSYQPTPLS